MRTEDGRYGAMRRNESARQFCGDSALHYCTTVSFAAAADAEGPILFAVEQAVCELIQRDDVACHVLTLMRKDRYEWIFYTGRLWERENIIEAFETNIDANRFSCRSEPDPGWAKYREYC